VVEEVRASYTVAGDVATFHQAAFKALLAAHLPGVAADQIALVVEAASVRVTATIAIASVAQRQSTFDRLATLAANTSAAGEALGITIEAASAPTVTRELRAPPSPPLSPPLSSPPQSSPSTSFSPAVLGMVVAAVAVGLLLLNLGVYLLGRRHGGRAGGAAGPVKEKEGVVYRDSTVPPQPPSMVAQVSSTEGVVTEKL